MSTFRIPLGAAAFAVLVFHVAAAAQDAERTEVNRSFGAFVLDAVDASAKNESVSTDSVARTIAERSIELRRNWTGEGAVTPAEDDWYKHKDGDDKWEGEKPGGGPPPWAPAHGYRRNFGAQQEQDLGHYVHQCVQEGLYGTGLIVAIRGVIERVSRGEEVGDRRTEREHRQEGSQREDVDHRVDAPEQAPSSKGAASKQKGKPQHGGGGPKH